MYPKAKATRVCSDAARINDLPDDLLATVLSFVPTKDAVATSILSKRWRPIWKRAVNLESDCVQTKRCCCNLLREKWKQPDFVPLSLYRSLEAFEWIGFKGREKTEKKAAFHILRNACNLKTMAITTSNTFQENTNILIDFDRMCTNCRISIKP
ncbi:putative FBD-associated F-box protein [Arabidopsis thaliana]